MTGAPGTVGGGEWWEQVPPPAVPVPAADLGTGLHGHPVLQAVPGVGVLADLRVIGDGDRAAGTAEVVPELDWWRVQLGAGPAHPRTVPLGALYVEHRVPYVPGTAGPEAPGAPGPVRRRLLASPDTPAARLPVPARHVPHLHGRRLIQLTPTGFAWDLRALSGIYEDPVTGDMSLMVVSAPDYYRWLLLGTAPAEPVAVPLHLLWTE